MKKLMKLSCLALVMVIVGCGPQKTQEVPMDRNDPSEPHNVTSTIPSRYRNPEREAIEHSLGNGIVNYGSGVYYFPKIRAEFANTLAGFLLINTNLEVTAMAPDVVRKRGKYIRSPDELSFQSDYGVTVGYFVTFREKEKK